MNNSTKRICRAGIIAALYVALTFVAFPIASSPIQFRPSEALTMLPLLFPEAIPALFVGCILSNWLTGCTLADILLGSTITLIASALTHLVGKYIKKDYLKIILGGFFPVIMNALLLPLIWLIYSNLIYAYYLEVLFLIASQSIAIYLLGTILYIVMKKQVERYPRLFQ